MLGRARYAPSRLAVRPARGDPGHPPAVAAGWDGRTSFGPDPQATFLPVLMLALAILAINLLGDELRAMIDLRLRRR